MHLTLFGEIQLFLLIAATSASFLYWINYKYKSLNRQIIRAIDIPVYLLNRQGFVVKLLNTPTEKANRLPFQNLGTLNIKDLVTDADEYVAVTRTEYPHFGQPDPKDKNRKW